MATAPVTAFSAPPSFGRALMPLLALALSMAIGFTMMGSFATIQEAAKLEMGMSDYALSMVSGLSAAIPMLLLSIPVGIAVDRGNRVRMLIALSFVWTLGTVLTAVAQSVPLLFFARMLTAIGTTGALTAALSLGADLCAPHERGRATLIVTLGKTLGTAAGFAMAGWLFGWFIANNAAGWFGGVTPWRATHYVLAILGVVMALPLFFLREPARHEVVAGNHAPFRIVAGELWSRRRFLIPLFAGQVGVVMADAAAGIWAAPVLQRGYGLSPEQFAGWMGLLILLTGILGAIIGGFAADAGQKSGRRGGLLIGAVIAALLAIPAALFPIAPGVPSFAVALGTLMLCGTVTGLITSVALTTLLPNELRGLCIGAFIAIAGLVGFGITPTLVAGVSSLLGGESFIGIALAIVGTSVSVLAFLAFLVAMYRAPRTATDEAA